jgi:hypothetical protein
VDSRAARDQDDEVIQQVLDAGSRFDCGKKVEERDVDDEGVSCLKLSVIITQLLSN